MKPCRFLPAGSERGPGGRPSEQTRHARGLPPPLSPSRPPPPPRRRAGSARATLPASPQPQPRLRAGSATARPAAAPRCGDTGDRVPRGQSAGSARPRTTRAAAVPPSPPAAPRGVRGVLAPQGPPQHLLRPTLPPPECLPRCPSFLRKKRVPPILSHWHPSQLLRSHLIHGIAYTLHCYRRSSAPASPPLRALSARRRCSYTHRKGKPISLNPRSLGICKLNS